MTKALAGSSAEGVGGSDGVFRNDRHALAQAELVGTYQKRGH